MCVIALRRRGIVLYWASGFLLGSGPHLRKFLSLLPSPWTPDSMTFIFPLGPFSFLLMRPVVAEKFVTAASVCSLYSSSWEGLTAEKDLPVAALVAFLRAQQHSQQLCSPPRGRKCTGRPADGGRHDFYSNSNIPIQGDLDFLSCLAQNWTLLPFYPSTPSSPDFQDT